MRNKGAAVLERATFSTSRLLEFCSEKELVNQTGHKRPEWPLVILKELLDNSVDACEESGVAPQINVVVDASGITVGDNGPGFRWRRSTGSWTIRSGCRVGRRM